MWGVNSGNYGRNIMFLQLIQIFGSSANNVFLLISGYFMISSGVNYKRIVNLIAEQCLYAWSIAAVVYGFRILPLSVKEVVRAAFPFWFGYNWYVCCYVIFSCFIPFLNAYLRSISRETYRRLLLVSLFLWSFAYTFKATNYMGTDFSIDHFFVVYMIGAYIRLYGIHVEKIRNWGKVSACLLFLTVASVILLGVGGYLLQVDRLVTNATFFATATNILNVCMTTSFFLAVLSAPPYFNRTINRIAKSVIGIFLLHFNPPMGSILWDKISPNVNFLYSPFLPVHALLKVSIVFLCCLLIDQIRIRWVEKPFMACLDRNWDALTQSVHSIWARVSKAIQ